MSRSLKLSWIPSMIVVVGLMVVSSCKDDEKPRSKFSFAETEVEVLEDDGKIELVINIDRPVSETVVLSYTLEGTAKEFGALTGGDYEISPKGGNITVAPGATQAIVEINLLPDTNFEVDFANQVAHETIIITLTGVISGPGEIVPGEGTQVTVNVYEDDLVVFLYWEANDADMDLLVWIDDPADDPDEGLVIVGASAGPQENGNLSEGLVLYSHLIDANYGFSYVYYAGTTEPLAFDVDFINFGGTLNGGTEALNFKGIYNLVNINDDWEQDLEAIVVQTATKAARNYDDITDIIIPDAGSRKRTLGGSAGKSIPNTFRGENGQKLTLTPSAIKWLRSR